MKKMIFLLSLASLSIATFSQPADYFITGRVIDAVSKLPLESASVFAQNTTLGTGTDAEGSFKLALPNGGYDLVVTFIGYQTETKRISTADAGNKNIVIELKRKEKELPDIIISGNEVKDGWEKYGVFFLENFLGKTENSRSCVIKNKEALKFYFSKKRNRLKVLADEPLEIANEALGYNIKYTIDSFIYDYNTQVTLYTGYPLFEEMQSPDLIQKNDWAANRLKTYNGSMLHFMRSLYNKQLKEEGFEIRFLIKTNDKEKAIPLLDFYGSMNYSKNDSIQTVEVLPKQNEIVVIYSKAKPEKTYINANAEASSKVQLSVLSFAPKQPVIIEVNGFYYRQTDIAKSEYLSWKRMGDMLPYDFIVK